VKRPSLRFLLALSLAVIASACDRAAPTAPSPAVPPSPAVIPISPEKNIGTLSGVVYAMNGSNSQNGTPRWVPVVGATVRVMLEPEQPGPAPGQVLTENNGGYRIFGLAAGLVSVEITHERYRTATATVALSTDNWFLPFMLFPEDHAVENITIGETVRSSVSADDPLCDTADPRVEELDAPCKTFQFSAPRTGTLAADLVWSSNSIFMELLTPSLGKCCRSPLRLQFAVTGGLTYTLSVGFHGTTGAGPRGRAVFELTTSLAP